MKPSHFSFRLWRHHVAGMVLIASPQALWGQEGGAGDVSFAQLWRQGGWAMYPLAVFSIGTFALILYNALAVRVQPLLRPDLVAQLKPLFAQGKLPEARQLCEQNPSLITNITRAGLERSQLENFDPEAVEKAMEEASIEEVAGPFGIIAYLSIVATLAPMVGMLGTVSGMIKAFRNIAVGGMGKPELLADNISEALITTAVGLIVGIPAMFAFFFFKSRYARLTSRVARQVGDLHHLLTGALRAPRGPAAEPIVVEVSRSVN